MILTYPVVFWMRIEFVPQLTKIFCPFTKVFASSANFFGDADKRFYEKRKEI